MLRGLGILHWPGKWPVLAIAVIVMMFASAPAFAHAILEDSQPKNGGTIAAGKTTIRLIYNSRIDQGRSLLTLTGPNQAKTTLPLDASPGPNILLSPVDLSPGHYVLHWQVLSIDGHITRGLMSFTVTGS